VPLQVELVSAVERLWSGEASMIVARTTEGDMGVLPGHAPVLAVLAAGEVRIDGSDGTVTAQVEDGFLSVDHDLVTLVSETAKLSSGSDRH
jgi:F-type H+-transporting ATPase subunit epsilon